MNCRKTLVTIMAISLILGSYQSFAQTAEDLISKGIQLEEIKGELEKAIEVYQTIVTRFSDNRPIAAKAQFHIGICYEKLGLEKARKAFQKVVEDYPDQVEMAKMAREKLSILLRAITDVKELKIRKVLEGQIVIYSSVSPDGRYYAYPDWNKGGNLAVRNFATGKSRILTEDKGGFAYDARWSPDGKNLAYAWTNWSDINTTEIRVAGLNGSGSRIIFKKQGVGAIPYDWSPDGKYVLALFYENPLDFEELRLISIKDGSIQTLKKYKSVESYMHLKEGYFSPDGRSITYTKEVKSGQSIHGDIFLFSLDEKKEIPLVRHPAEEYLLGWSPDGKHVLFASNRTGTIGVWAIRVSEQGIHKDPVLIRDNMGPIIPLGVTDDGALYYGLRNDLFFIYLTGLDPESGRIIDGPKKLSLPFEGHNSDPCFSPDGDRLAYISDRGVFRKFTDPVLCIHNLKSGENTEVSPNLKVFQQPRWAPDGNKIHVMGCVKEWDWAIYSIDSQTKKVEPVIPPEVDSDVCGHCWAESGNSIYYLRVKAIAEGSTILNNRIIHHNLETGREKEIGAFQSVNSTHELFGISPDGKKLFFVQRDTNQNKDIINVIPVSGGNSQKICILDLNKYMIMDLTWTSDGRFIIFSSLSRSEESEGQCELMRVSAEGGNPEKLGISMHVISYLSIHPEGRKIAFSAKGQTRKPTEIWVMENFLPKGNTKK